VAGTWTCQRQDHGRKCKALNPTRKQLCKRCGKRKPARKRPAHLATLDLTYEQFVEVNGGSEKCGICGIGQKANGLRLHRDHDHRAPYAARGLLCFRCNAALRPYMTAAWLKAAVLYIERTA